MQTSPQPTGHAWSPGRPESLADASLAQAAAAAGVYWSAWSRILSQRPDAPVNGRRQVMLQHARQDRLICWKVQHTLVIAMESSAWTRTRLACHVCNELDCMRMLRRVHLADQIETCRTRLAIKRLCCRATRALVVFVWQTLSLQDLHGMPTLHKHATIALQSVHNKHRK